jgi:hypothetical protein
VSDEGKRKEVRALQADLSKSGLSRRAFLDRLKGLGVGFGAAFILGVNEFDAHAKGASAPVPADGLSLQSSNPAVDAIIGEGQEDRRAAGKDRADETKTAATSNKFSKYNKYAKYEKYNKYTKYEKYTKYDKYTKYSKYDKYTKYAKYDKYTKYAKYDKYTKYARYSKAIPTR